MFQVYRMHIRNRIKSNTKITRKEGGEREGMGEMHGEGRDKTD